MIEVTCAIIRRDELILIAQRGQQQSNPLKWEFPGGKIEPDESAEDCIVREVQEELGIAIKPLQQLQSTVCDCGSYPITLIPFVCSLEQGEPEPVEHHSIEWIRLDELKKYDWCKADQGIIEELLQDR